ncbi:MAG TPA: DMT family transporter [Steroidobacteraceae bacterium]|nr:DMT family transporter [Steroidobacteraceae bacterium]
MNAAVLFGLASALGYGITDYLSRRAGRAVGVWRTLFYGDMLVFVAMAAWLSSAPGTRHLASTADGAAWAAAIGSGVILLAAAASLTQGLMHGTIAVVAPVAASYGAISTLLSVVAGERLSAGPALGIVVTLIGVLLVSIPEGGRRELRQHLSSSGVGWAIGAALGYGVGFWLQGRFAVPALGAAIPVGVSYGLVVVLLPLLHRPLGVSLAVPTLSQFRPVLATGLFGGMGYGALTLGLATGRIAIVVVLSTLASAVTVVLARLVDRAPVARHQWVGMMVVIAGLILIKI